MKAAVDIHSDEVASTLYLGKISKTTGEGRPPAFNGPKKALIEELIQQGCAPAVQNKSATAGLEHYIIVRPSHLCLGLNSVDRAISARMAIRHVVDDMQ